MEKSNYSIRKLLIIAICCLTAVFIERQVSILWGKRTVNKNPIQSYGYEQAKIEAGATNRHILLNFSAYWCGACRQFERKILSDTNVQTAIENKYIYVRLEQTNDDDDHLFEQYDISAYPTLLVVDAAGKPIEPLFATTNKESFLDQLKSTHE